MVTGTSGLGLDGEFEKRQLETGKVCRGREQVVSTCRPGREPSTNQHLSENLYTSALGQRKASTIPGNCLTPTHSFDISVQS